MPKCVPCIHWSVNYSQGLTTNSLATNTKILWKKNPKSAEQNHQERLLFVWVCCLADTWLHRDLSTWHSLDLNQSFSLKSMLTSHHKHQRSGEFLEQACCVSDWAHTGFRGVSYGRLWLWSSESQDPPGSPAAGRDVSMCARWKEIWTGCNCLINPDSALKLTQLIHRECFMAW